MHLQGELTCHASSCEDERAYSILEDIIKMAADDDLNRPAIRSLEVEESQGWKFVSCSHCQELCQQASWLLHKSEQPTSSLVIKLTQLLT